MSYKTELQNNNIDLASILESINKLPEAGGGNFLIPMIIPKVTFSSLDIGLMETDIDITQTVS